MSLVEAPQKSNNQMCKPRQIKQVDTRFVLALFDPHPILYISLYAIVNVPGVPAFPGATGPNCKTFVNAMAI